MFAVNLRNFDWMVIERGAIRLDEEVTAMSDTKGTELLLQLLAHGGHIPLLVPSVPV